MTTGSSGAVGQAGSDGRAVAVRAARSLRPGDHVCWAFGDDAAREGAVAGCVAEGLRRNHKILYYTDAVPVPEVLAGLERAGIPPVAWRSGQVAVYTADETYLSTGRFDPDTTIEGWARESGIARAAPITDGRRCCALTARIPRQGCGWMVRSTCRTGRRWRRCWTRCVPRHQRLSR